MNAKTLQPITNVKNLIGIASGKGGVGKSTLAVNLALALQAEGATAGILDADIYGPSQPWMLGTSTATKPLVTENNKMIPVISHGLPSMSMAYLIDGNDTPMVWRGPMVSQALQQLAFETEWPALDYLIVDLPPGTGDIQLTLAQKLPVTGIVIITTPQDVALLDAKKALNMFRKLEIPVFGVVENMAGHICSACGHLDPIFGEKGGAEMAEQFKVPLLGKIPLLREIREDTDAGLPTVAKSEQGEIAEIYRGIAKKIQEKIVKMNTRSKFLNVSIST
jgi:ATP-binding protein involved in chromosome partitioning